MYIKSLVIPSVLFVLTIACDGSESIEASENPKNTIEETTNTIPVEAMEISMKKIKQKLPLTGVMIPNNSVEIIAEVSGKVTSIMKELGDYISAGQTLAIIDDVVPESQFKQAEAQVISTESNMNILESNLQSDKILFENGDISEFEFNNAQFAFKNAEAQYLSALAQLITAKKTFEDTRIKSPISGFISRKNIDFGTMVPAGSPVYKIVNLSQMKIEVSVPQEIINRVKIGISAIVNVSALNGKTFNGIVKRISPEADKTSGGFNIEIIVPNKENLIKAGMTAKIELQITKEQKVLAVPEFAIVQKNEESYVYKITNDFAELVKVNLGETLGQSVVIDNGIREGNKIVIVGMKNLGMKTKVKIEKLH